MIAPEDLDLLRLGLRHALTTESTTTVDAALDELGWRDALSADRTTVVPLIFTEMGAANATATVLDDLLLVTLGFAAASDAGVVLPGVGLRTPPGRLSGKQLWVRGTGSERLLRDGSVVVVAVTDDGADRVLRVQTADLAVHPITGADPAFGLVAVAADGIAVEAVAEREVVWSQVVSTAQLALAFQMLGASRAMLEMAREHALARNQFGRPIASFQAVRHRLAESLVAVEGLTTAASAAWEAFCSPADTSTQLDWPAAIAKAVAGRNARVVARNCQQVLAGIGFTAEHPFHRYFRRVMLLDQLLGSARELTAELGGEVLAAGRLPAPIPL